MPHLVKGWCPGALRPMRSGDGYLLRIRPPLGWITPEQSTGLARISATYGSGVVDLTNRANLQIRGVAEEGLDPAIAALAELGLVDPGRERTPPVMVSPYADEAVLVLAKAVEAAISGAEGLPGKFGIAVDTGPDGPWLARSPADIRLERADPEQMILRLDGEAMGTPVATETAPRAIREVIDWYLSGGGTGRMADHLRRGHRPPGHLTPQIPGQPMPAPPAPGETPQGILVACAFGRVPAKALAALGGTGPVRVTPWRMLLRAGASPVPDHPALILDDASVLRVSACTGAPGCAQALQPTQALANQLSRHLGAGQRLHVSGCPKGCAHPGPADLTVVGTSTGYDLITRGTARDIPTRRNLPATVLSDALVALKADQ